MKVIVYHSGFGCDTGCCGHRVEMFEDDVVAKEGFEPGWVGGTNFKFSFDHPYEEEHLEFAKKLVREKYGEEHVKDLDWEHCIILDN